MGENKVDYLWIWMMIVLAVIVFTPTVYNMKYQDENRLPKNTTCKEVVVNGEVYKSESCNVKSNTLESNKEQSNTSKYNKNQSNKLESNKEQSNNQTKEPFDKIREKYGRYVEIGAYVCYGIIIPIMIYYGIRCFKEDRDY